jgi:hypothetical protein
MKGKLYILTNDKKREVRELDKPPTGDEIREILGGWMELVPRFNTYEKQPCIAYCDEEGKMKNLSHNYEATHAWSTSMKMSLHNIDPLRGTIVVLTGDKEFMEAQ